MFTSSVARTVAIVLLCSCALVACGGGGGSSSSAVVPSQTGGGTSSSTPTPSPAPTSTPPTGVSTSSLNGYAQNVAIPSYQGYSGNIVFPRADVGSSLSQQVSLTSTPALQSAGRRPLSFGISTALYDQLTFSQTTTFLGLPAFTFTLPSVGSGSYYLAVLDPQLGWILPVDGPGSVYGTAVTFSGNGKPIAFKGGTPYVFALYSAPGASPTSAPTLPPAPRPTTSGLPPTPSPSPSPIPSTPSPSPSPTPVPTATPTPFPPGAFSIWVPAIPDINQQVTATIYGTVTPPLTASLSDPSIASVSLTGTTVTLTGLKVGSTALTLTDANGGKGYVWVYVSSSTVTVQ